MEIISSHLKITSNIAGISEKSNYILIIFLKIAKIIFSFDFHLYVDVDFFGENRYTMNFVQPSLNLGSSIFVLKI